MLVFAAILAIAIAVPQFYGGGYPGYGGGGFGGGRHHHHHGGGFGGGGYRGGQYGGGGYYPGFGSKCSRNEFVILKCQKNTYFDIT